MAAVNSSWLTAHGKLWYDDQWYRLAWIIWPQALAAVVVLWFWAAPSTTKSAKWAVPVDPTKRYEQLLALRDAAKSSQASMDKLEKDAIGGEMIAQFFYATLLDPDLKLSTIVQADAVKSTGWYARAANQGDQMSMSNLAIGYFNGTYIRQDYTRACFYARNVAANGFAAGLRVKGDCYARGLGGTTIDMVQAANAYEMSANKGNNRALAALGYFYENGLGGRSKSGETALKYYRAAADKGDSLGLHNLGAAYNSGLLGLQRDPNESSRLIVRSLETKYDVTVQSLTTHPEVWTFEFWQYLQRRLAEKGLYSGQIDGRANPATLDAVRRLAR
jgi:hypothetical protein